VILVLVWVPMVVSAVLGADWLVRSPARAPVKALAVGAFLLASWLQLFSPLPLAGLMLQLALALALALRRRMEAMTGKNAARRVIP